VLGPGKCCDPKSPLTDVVPAEGSWLTISGHKLVERVDALHVVHDTESEVLRDVPGAIHPGADCVHEGLNLGSVTLWSTSEALASILGDPDGLIEGGEEILAIADEFLSISTIPMDGNGIDRAATAVTNETGQPRYATSTGGDSRRYEAVALVLEGLDVLLPERSSVTGIKVRLTSKIGFIEA